MLMRVEIKGQLLRWARERAGRTLDDLRKRFPKLKLWEANEAGPTLKQLEDFANTVHVPIGFLFLQEPPEEPKPIPDFRTMGDRPLDRLSPDLLDMIYACQRRQEWYREYAESAADEPLAFVGSMTIDTPIVRAAAEIRAALHFDLEARAACGTWEEALRRFLAQVDAAGILVMCSGIVLNNTHRKLDPEEFRGFALVDLLAPLVFINGSDSKSAQMFTLAHEIAHLWLGQTALSNSTVATRTQNNIETWCNRVAAETLAPLDVVRYELRRDESVDQNKARLARRFKVSTLVILQRMRDAGRLTWDQFTEAYAAERQYLATLAPKNKKSGGDFYATTAVRYGKRFTRALVHSTLEGHTQYRDAYRLLGISKSETFRELSRSLDFAS